MKNVLQSTRKYNNMSLQEHRLNSEITSPQIRLIDAHGEMKGIVNLQEALHLADYEELDLVEIQPKEDPPVCRIMDYGKFRYDQQKKAQVAKKHQKQVETKEIQFRPVIDDHDYQTKLNHVKEFLSEGNKVRLVIRMKGRERLNNDLARKMSDKLVDDLKDVASFDNNAGRPQEGQILLLAQPAKVVVSKNKSKP